MLRADIDVKSDSFFITKKGEQIYPTLVYRIVNNYFGRVSVKRKSIIIATCGNTSNTWTVVA